jgi:D-arabinose 1-dehydrogenase-like Zn-dependent alcohol dehydrogenase
VALTRPVGHEIVGDVVAVGPGEALWKVGDRVGSGWHGGHCTICNNCRSGDFVMCEKEAVNGISQDGGYAEFVRLRSEAIARLPDGLDPAEVAPILCAGITTYNSLRNMDFHPGDVVAVQGIGGLGHLAVQFATKFGCHVVALSSSDSKKDLAKELGAQTYLDGSKVNQAEELAKLGGAKVWLLHHPSRHEPKLILYAGHHVHRAEPEGH